MACFYGVLFTSTLHNIFSKPIPAFPNNHCRNNGQWWERNEFCRNDYHQPLEKILAKPGIEPATSCSQVRNATNWAMGLSSNVNNVSIYSTCRLLMCQNLSQYIVVLVKSLLRVGQINGVSFCTILLHHSCLVTWKIFLRKKNHIIPCLTLNRTTNFWTWPNWKHFADDKLNVVKMTVFSLIEQKTLGKGEKCW